MFVVSGLKAKQSNSFIKLLPSSFLHSSKNNSSTIPKYNSFKMTHIKYHFRINYLMAYFFFSLLLFFTVKNVIYGHYKIRGK